MLPGVFKLVEKLMETKLKFFCNLNISYPKYLCSELFTTLLNVSDDIIAAVDQNKIGLLILLDLAI